MATFSPERAIPGAVDLPHPTRTDGFNDLVRTPLRAGSQWH